MERATLYRLLPAPPTMVDATLSGVFTRVQKKWSPFLLDETTSQKCRAVVGRDPGKVITVVVGVADASSTAKEASALQLDGPRKLWQPGRRDDTHICFFFSPAFLRPIAGITTCDHVTLRLLRCYLLPLRDCFQSVGGMGRQTDRSEMRTEHCTDSSLLMQHLITTLWHTWPGRI